MGVGAAGALFGYWNWIEVLGASVDMPEGYGPRDVWLNQPVREHMPYWAPIWAPPTVLGTVAFLLAGRFLREEGPQTLRTIGLCVCLNLLSFPFNLALSEIAATIYVHPPAPWYVPVHAVGMSFLAGFSAAAINFFAHGMAWIIVSIIVGGAIAQASRVSETFR
jgi:hypothetical protein